MHDPELLILDEPANGLDPAGIVEIRNVLFDLAHEQDVTVFMSSHILGEVLRLVHRIGIIHGGERLLQELDVDELERNRLRRLLVQTRDIQATRGVLRDAGFIPHHRMASSSLTPNVRSSTRMISPSCWLQPVAAGVIGQDSARIVITAALTIISITPIIFFASAGHGYLPPMGVATLAIFLSQIIAVAGWGEYFPWSIPALYSQGDDLDMISFVIVAVTGIVGVVATFLWWTMADQTH